MSRYYKGHSMCGPTMYVTTPRRFTPGPQYALRSLTGYQGHEVEGTKPRAPAFSMRIRSRPGDKYVSPGPAAYLPTAKQTRTGNDGTPAYSLSVRHKDLYKNENPGPGMYAPEKHFYPPSQRPPDYSFGKRLQGRKNLPKTPAPNTYILPSRIGTLHPDLNRAPAYFITFRSNRGGFDEDMCKTPGPAAYSGVNQNIYKNAQPQFTMRTKCQPPGDKTKNPGPAAHNREACPHTAYSMKKGAPAFSFGTRHHDHAVEPIFTDCEIETLPQICS